MEQNSNNRVLLTGQIIGQLTYSHSLYGEGFYSGMIAVARLSGVVDTLPITVSERILRSFDMSEGKRVTLKGQLRSYNKNVDGHNRLILTVFAHYIEPTEDPPKNEIYINGFICKKPIYRITPFHREIADMLLAVNRAYNKSDYIPCITWGRSARYAQNLDVGCRVEAVGRVQSREYQKNLEDGITVYRTAFEVSVSSIKAIEQRELGD